MKKISVKKSFVFLCVILLFVSLAISSRITDRISPSVQAQSTCPSSVQVGDLQPPDFLGLSIIPVKVYDLPTLETLDGSSGVIGDGNAVVFEVEVVKDQIFESLASEVDLTSIGSYVRSYMYDKDGNMVTQGDTRLNTVATYTGKYYVLVTTFGCKSGRVSFRVYDTRLADDSSMQVRLQDNKILTGKNLSIKQPYQILLSYQELKLRNETEFEYLYLDNLNKIRHRVLLSDMQDSLIVDYKMTKIDETTVMITPKDSYYFPVDTLPLQLRLVYINEDSSNSGSWTDYTINAQSSGGSNVCQSDINQDGWVDISDYSLLSRDFFKNTASCWGN